MLSVRHGAMGHAAVTEGGEEVRPRVRLHVVLIHLLGLNTSQRVDLAWNYDYYLSISLYYPSIINPHTIRKSFLENGVYSLLLV